MIRPDWTTFAVFGLDASGKCLCANPACTSPGKHPMVESWRNLAAGYQGRIPDGARVGLATGKRSGVWVLDVDVYKDPEGLGEWVKALPPTLTMKTGRGGLHFYWSLPEDFEVPNTQGYPRQYVDVKGEGGLVVKWPVLHDLPISPAPPWLLDLLRSKATGSPALTSGLSWEPVGEDDPTYKARVDLAIRYCQEEPLHKRGSKYNNEAATVRLIQRITVGLLLDGDVAWDIFQEHYNERLGEADRWDDERELGVKFQKAMKGEMYHGSTPGSAWEAEQLKEGLAAAAGPAEGPPPLEFKLSGSFPENPRVYEKLKKKDPDHVYGYAIGDVSQGSLDPATLNDVLHTLQRDAEWDGVLGYDEFAEDVVAIDPPIRLSIEPGQSRTADDSDITAIELYFEVAKAKKTAGLVRSALTSVARTRTFHPVKDWLASLGPGDPQVFEGLAARWFGDDAPIADVFLKKFMVAAVRRVLSPGCKADNVLILHGKQGAKKSSFFCALFGSEWTLENMPKDLSNKDAGISLQGRWCAVFDEMSAFKKSSLEASKSFVSLTHDNYRPPYGVRTIRRARQNVFGATTNADKFLADATGERRYWVIHVRDGHYIPLEDVRAMRDSVWAAAYALALDPKVPHWMEEGSEEAAAAEAARDSHREDDVWEDRVLSLCRGSHYVQTEWILAHLNSGIESEMKRADMNATHKKRVEDILTRHGFKYGRPRLHQGEVLNLLPLKTDDRPRCFTVPPAIAAAAPLKANRIPLYPDPPVSDLPATN